MSELEVIPVSFSTASGVFDNPLSFILPLFFGLSLAQALQALDEGNVLVNKQPVGRDYVLHDGDLLVYNNNGIIVKRSI